MTTAQLSRLALLLKQVSAALGVMGFRAWLVQTMSAKQCNAGLHRHRFEVQDLHPKAALSYGWRRLGRCCYPDTTEKYSIGKAKDQVCSRRIQHVSCTPLYVLREILGACFSSKLAMLLHPEASVQNKKRPL